MISEPVLTKQVLVVEDDPTAASVVRIALERNGFSVTGAKDLTNAQENLDARRFELIILDINLPDGSGLELLRRLRLQSYKDTPVLVLSGLKQDLNVVRGLELGANDYMTKPFSVRELLARVGRLAR